MPMMEAMWLWMFFWLLLAIAGVVLIVWAITRSRGDHTLDQRRGDRALAMLRERFASGEISEAEYHERRRVLEDTQH